MTTTLLTLLLGLAAAAPPSTQPRPSEPQSYVFFGFDRERIHERSFLDEPALVGAQLKYSWKELEPEPGRYDLKPLLADLAFLEEHGKRLFVQLQDVSFSKWVLVPDYLTKDPRYGGGVAAQYDRKGPGAEPRFAGWVARRWDPAVRARFVALLEALGRAVDGRVEGINLAETAVDFADSPEHTPKDLTPDGYRAAFQAIMTAAKRAFPRSHVIVYANFMPGEWLPDDDHGHLRAVYDHAAKTGVGVGGPDLMPWKKWQRLHSYPLIAARPAGVVAGVAVQDGNLAERDPKSGDALTVAELYRYASEELRLDYVFWGTEEPYYSRDVIPFLHARHRAARPGP